VDETMKASHLLRYSTLKQLLADFVDREQKEYTALREIMVVGIKYVDDSLRSTKFIQQEDTTNSKHKSQAQTIFSTPNMASYNISRATSLFETYNPGVDPPSA
jgi:hypothetical protein